ncbi:MAG: aminotransferase class I/II-fold pyridoxal phosphate-dependent enzyme, partial [Candidatus Omnitrophota bacterium]
MDRIYMAGPWITEHEVAVVKDAMRNGWYEHAYDYCEKFQKEFAAYHGRKYGIMTPNCTTATHLFLTGLGISKGDEVILPECTWIATGAGITYLGATPVFCDIDRVNWCLDPGSVKKRITPKTKAIIAVDLYGNMPLMDELRTLADQQGIFLIEDAAEALGSVYKGIKAGKFGIGSVFSFHRTKTLTTGEGGMLLLDDDRLYERCMFLRDHGRKADGGMYYNYEVTYKYMPFNLQAALGYAQFQRIDALVKKKRDQLQMYRERLSDIDDVELNPEPEGGVNGAWSTALVFGRSHDMTKQKAIEKLAKLQIPARPFFYPLSSLPAYPACREVYEPQNVVAYDISERGINLPGAANLTEEQIDRICDGIRSVLKTRAGKKPGERVAIKSRRNELPSLKGQRVLITGGLGFIGSNLVHKCLELGAKVTIYDNMAPNSGGNRYNIHAIQDSVTLYEHDICDFDQVSRHVIDKDVIFNCAALISHPLSMKEPWIDLDVNSRSVLNLLEAARRLNKNVKFIQLSTTTQLGKLEYSPADEKHPEFPIDIYSANKTVSEKYVLIYANAYGMRAAVIRL